MFPAIELGEQSIGYTRPKTRLAGDAGTVIAINRTIPRIPKGSASMDPSRSRLPTTAPVEIAVSSPDTQLPAISLIFIYVQQHFPHPRTPMPRHLHTLRCPQVQTQTWCPGWVLQGFTALRLENLQRCSVRDPAKIISYIQVQLFVFFPTSPIQLKLGTANRWETTNSSPLDQSNYQANQQQY
jgi:hypothetical protein